MDGWVDGGLDTGRSSAQDQLGYVLHGDQRQLLVLTVTRLLLTGLWIGLEWMDGFEDGWMDGPASRVEDSRVQYGDPSE